VTRAIVGEALGESNPMNIDIPTASISIIDYPAKGFSEVALASGSCARPVVRAVGIKPEL
jgi:broad specificity phosphatase PhoE